MEFKFENIFLYVSAHGGENGFIFSICCDTLIGCSLKNPYPSIFRIAPLKCVSKFSLKTVVRSPF